MRVKRYVVDTLPDALHKIRQELGNDAVILNTKQLKVGGFLGMFGKKKIEVIAAIDNEARAAKAKQPQRSQATPVDTLQEPPEARSPHTVTPNALAAKLYRSSASRAEGLDATELANPKSASAPEEEKQPASAAMQEKVAGQANNPIEQFKLAAAKTIQEAASRPAVMSQADANSSAASRAEQQELLSEIKEMKALLANLSAGGLSHVKDETSQMADPFRHLEQRLSEQGVLPALIDSLKQTAGQEITAAQEELDEAAARRLLRSQIVQLLGQTPITGIGAGSRIVRFVGPTGVGKTTTIAKLAAEQVLKHNKKIGFITSDTYRIAAIDQLKTYGTILNVPVEVVFSPEEMEAALGKLSDRDLIFMDTAGRNYRDEASIADVVRLFGDYGQSETYLVLSLAAKYSDIREIAGNFKPFNIDKVLWTKLDETTSYGAILNLQSEFSLPMSYITDGQNVPDDIALLEPNTIADLILGEDAHE